MAAGVVPPLALRITRARRFLFGRAWCGRHEIRRTQGVDNRMVRAADFVPERITLMRKLDPALWTGLFLAGFVLTAGPLSQAAEPEPDVGRWENVQRLAPGSAIQIVLNDVKSYSGRLVSAGEETLSVRLSEGERTFSRRDVLRVSAKGQKHRWRNALVGMGIGVGLGFALAAHAVKNDSEQEPQYFTDPVAFGALGAGAGALMPTGGWHEVYRAR